MKSNETVRLGVPISKWRTCFIEAGHKRHILIGEAVICGAHDKLFQAAVQSGRKRGSASARRDMLNHTEPYAVEKVSCSACKRTLERLMNGSTPAHLAHLLDA